MLFRSLEDPPAGSVAEIVEPWLARSFADDAPEWALVPIPVAFPGAFPSTGGIVELSGRCSDRFVEANMIGKAGGEQPAESDQKGEAKQAGHRRENTEDSRDQAQASSGVKPA